MLLTYCPEESNERCSMVFWAVVGLVIDCEANEELPISMAVIAVYPVGPLVHCVMRKERVMLAIQSSIPAMRLNCC